MKTNEKKVATDNLKSDQKRRASLRRFLAPSYILLMLIFSTNVSFAHCDTMDGPLIKDAKIALGKGNVNYVLKWVQPEDETEIKEAFSLVMKVRKSGADAQLLADKYFFETVVRLHRSGEGVPFTGVKPSGTPIDEKVLAADKSIEKGNLSPLKDLVPKEMLPELQERFNKAMSLKNFDVNNVAEGREYIEAYVQFFKFAEGEEEEHVQHESHNH
ncbi:MAG: DUF6448 family protein [Bacteroidales bacterium]